MRPHLVATSGRWEGSFTLASAEEVTLSFRYNLTLSSEYEANEFGQAIASIDGAGIAGAGSDYIVQLDGDGNGGSPTTSGWVQFNVNLGTLSAGSHTITIGGYNNIKTMTDEITTVEIDDVLVETVPPPQVCGNGVPEGSEDCDNGASNGMPGQCCSSTCSFETAGTECRAAASSCDEAEQCTGTEATCPVDVFSPTFKPCDDGVVCTDDETCDGAGGCGPGTPIDAFCDNGLFCDGAEVCDTLLDCQAGTPVDCDDADSCTLDVCDENNDLCVYAPETTPICLGLGVEFLPSASPGARAILALLMVALGALAVGRRRGGA